MDPLYHPRLKDREVEYAIKLRQTHERIKSGLVVMAGASTLYLKDAMHDDAYRYLLSTAEEAYHEARRELQELEPPAALMRLHRQYLDGLEAYTTALHQLGKLLGSTDRRHDAPWLLAVAELMSDGTRQIKRVTLNLWLDEYITEHGDELDHRAHERDEARQRAETAHAHPPGEDDRGHGPQAADAESG